MSLLCCEAKAFCDLHIYVLHQLSLPPVLAGFTIASFIITYNIRGTTTFTPMTKYTLMRLMWLIWLMWQMQGAKIANLHLPPVVMHPDQHNAETVSKT